MATRLYLSNAAPGYTPATKRGAWDSSAATLARKLGPAPSGAAATAGVAETSVANDFDVLLGRWISDPVERAGSLSGTAQWIIGALESSINANDFFHVHIYATTGDSDTVRGTLLTDSVGTTEWQTTAAGAGEGAKTLSAVSLSVGDRVVVEVGYRAQNTSTTSFTGTINYGNTGTTDLTSASAAVTTNPGWIEFSDPNAVLPHLVQNLRDNFDDNSRDTTKWPTVNGTASETGGVCSVSAVAAGTFSGFESAGQYALADSAVSTKMAPPSLETSTFAVARLALYDIPSSYGTYIYAYIDIGAPAIIGWRCSVAGVSQWNNFFEPATGNEWLVQSPYVQIRESGGTLYFEASRTAAPGSWMTLATQPTPAAIRSSNRLAVAPEAQRSATASAGTAATFDNLNITPPSGVATGSWTFAGAASGKRTPKASADGTAAFAGAATGRALRRGTGAATWTFTGAATGEATRRGTATGSWAFTGAAEAAAPHRGTATGTWAITGAATGRTAPRGTAAGSWQATGASTGRATRRGAAAGTTAFTGAAVGQSPHGGAATGTWTASGAAAGATAKSGTATAATTWIGVALSGNVATGAAAATTTWAGSAVGRKAPRGAATGGWNTTGAAVGRTSRAGTAAGGWGFTGAATSGTTRRGATAGTWSTAGSATGRTVRRGTSSGTWPLTGTATGRVRRQGVTTGANTWTSTAAGIAGLLLPTTATATGTWQYIGAAAGAVPTSGVVVHAGTPREARRVFVGEPVPTLPVHGATPRTARCVTARLPA